jgi:DNA-directed DNA polymerase III PolC
MNTLRNIVFSSSRLSELTDSEFKSLKKELGAIEIHNKEEYLLYLYDNKIIIENNENSMVAYVIGITNNKPISSIKYIGGSIPDIDIDFEDNRRHEVIEYLINKYGQKNVAGIGTYNFLWAKGAIKSAARALDIDIKVAEELANAVPDATFGRTWHINEAIEESESFRQLIDSNPLNRKIIKAAIGIDNMISAKSQHAAGFVISDVPISDIAPVWRRTDDHLPILEFDKNEAEDLGFVKADILGLRTLSVISDTIRLIKERHNIDIAPNDIPLNDKDTFELLSSGKLLGIFQLEGKDISIFANKYQPQNILDVTLISAGYRPGSMQFLTDILQIRKDGTWTNNQPTSEKYPILKEILAETYGYFIYQEQIQAVMKYLADYTDSESVTFLKLISKKDRSKLPKEKKRFTEGALKHNLTLEDIEGLWIQMEAFADYSFNKSHAVAYSIITVQTAWLKQNYKAEFYTANIINDIGDQAKVSEFIAEAQYFNIRILPPDINNSNVDFTIVNDRVINFGLGGIRSVGNNTAELIVEERSINGKFSSLHDFMIRCKPRVNVTEQLVRAGCFSSMYNKAHLLKNINKETDEELNYIQYISDIINYFVGKSWPTDCINEDILPLPIHTDYTIHENYLIEKDTLGINLIYDPFIILRQNIRDYLHNNHNDYICFVTSIKPFKSNKGGIFQTRNQHNEIRTILLSGENWKQIQKNYKDFENNFVIFVDINLNKEGTAYWSNGIDDFWSKLNLDTNNDYYSFLNTKQIIDAYDNGIPVHNGRFIFKRFIINF